MPIRSVSRSAEAVEQEIEDGADGGVDERSDGETDSEERLRVSEQKPLNEYDDALVDGKEYDGEGEARGRMLRVKLAADRRGDITDQSFRDPIKTEWSFPE